MKPPLPSGLYALCDDTFPTERSVEEQLEALLEGGVRVVQLRLKRTPMRQASELAARMVARCRDAGALLIVNDRVDLALVSGAHGVHLGDEDLPPGEARRLLPADALLGVTARNAAQAAVAARAGADYVGVGPVYATATKQVAHAPLGPWGLAEVVRASPLPVVAIAGIGLGNIEEVAATGVHGAAVVSDLLGASDLAGRARALADAFARGAERIPSRTR